MEFVEVCGAGGKEKRPAKVIREAF